MKEFELTNERTSYDVTGTSANLKYTGTLEKQSGKVRSLSLNVTNKIEESVYIGTASYDAPADGSTSLNVYVNATYSQEVTAMLFAIAGVGVATEEEGGAV